MNINRRLVIFAQRELVIAHNDTERFRINVSVGGLKRKLKLKYKSNIIGFILFGSYTRNTILPRRYDLNSDIDLMVIFNTNNGIKTPETYRKNLIDVLDIVYPNSI